MKKKELEMLTLSDINALTNSHDGDIYSDLYKDVYGCRPRGATFGSLEDFNEDFDFLAKCLDRMIEDERAEKAIRWEQFLARVDEVKQLVSNVDTSRAVEIIADAEGIDKEELSFYGWESLEWKLGLQYGSIKPFLAEAV
jgi:hypothetical protein